MSIRRRIGRLVAAGLGVAMTAAALTACSSSSNSDPSIGATGSSAGATAAAFPATVSTEFGDVTISARPKRIVALGWADAEFLLALGIQPIGVVDWLGFGGGGVGPWATSLQTTKPTLLSSQELDTEKILDLKPDLILNTRSDNSEKTYNTLKQIAPTVYGPKGVTSFGTSWRDQMKLISTAVGEPAKGTAMVEALSAKIQATAAADAGALGGKTVVVGAAFGGQYGAYVSGDGRADFMTELGLKISPAVEALKKDSFYVAVSAERLDLLSADITVMFSLDGKGEALKADKALNAIDSAKAKHLLVLTDKNDINAFSATSILSLQYALDHVVPQIVATAKGEGV